MSSYFVNSTGIDVKHLWIDFFQENNFSLALFPPVLQLKMEESGLSLEKDVLKSVKDYSNDFIEFFIENKGGR